jgi:hypothetical protein
MSASRHACRHGDDCRHDTAFYRLVAPDGMSKRTERIGRDGVLGQGAFHILEANGIASTSGFSLLLIYVLWLNNAKPSVGEVVNVNPGLPRLGNRFP